MRHNPEVIKQGVQWVTQHLVSKLPYTVVGNPTYEWNGDCELTAHFRAEELYYDSEEQGEDLYYNMEFFFEELPENYRPKELHFTTEVGEKGYASITVYYLEEEV